MSFCELESTPKDKASYHTKKARFLYVLTQSTFQMWSLYVAIKSSHMKF